MMSGTTTFVGSSLFVISVQSNHYNSDSHTHMLAHACTHTHTHKHTHTHTHTQLQCNPGQTVQQVIEAGIPEFSTTSYQVYQFPSRALLNPEKDANILQDQEISIEPLRSFSPGMDIVFKCLRAYMPLSHTDHFEML